MKTQDERWEFVNCGLCASAAFKELCVYNDIRIVQCRQCNLIYRNPRFREDVNREFYRTDYYNGYRGIEERIFNARVPLFRKVLLQLEKRITSASRRILDIGCGQGHFLKMAADSGWQVEGVELAKSACEYAQERLGLELINRTVFEANFEKNHFDAVTLWNVLDHLLNPLDTLKEIVRILKPQGILVIRVVNVDFHLLIHRLFSIFHFDKKFNKFHDPSVIVNFGFNVKTIRRILEKADFRDIKVYNSPLSSGDPYKSFERYGTQMVGLLKNLFYLLSGLISYLSLRRLNINPSMLVYARKT